MEMKRARTGEDFSSNVHSVGYDPESKTLAVCFFDKDRESPGQTYHYFGVEPEHHAEMSKDDVSTGSYLRKHIIGKPDVYKFKKQE
jgi:hypothetical protein